MPTWRELVDVLRFLLVAAVAVALYAGVSVVVGAAAFPFQAEGSLVHRGGRVVGSLLVAQPFSRRTWFWPRPSATAGGPDDPEASGASNLGPTNPALVRSVAAALRRYAGVPPARVPPSLVESSASGLDPDITPRSALLQVPRVARARHLRASCLAALVRRLTRGPALGLFGHPSVDVLALNLELPALATSPSCVVRGGESGGGR